MQFRRRKLERVRYWQGQTLRSRDFRDLGAVEAQRRWWHNRALHSAYGVYDGLVAAPASAQGKLSGVKLFPGVAYDCFGRELILDHEVMMLLPENSSRQASRFLLIIRYQEQEHHTCGNDAASACWPTSPSSSSTVELSWKPAELFQPTDGVALAEVKVIGVTEDEGSKGRSAFDFSFLPLAPRPVARPLLASGVTIPGYTAWQPWTVSVPINDVQFQTVLGVQTRIDTSAAGFTEIPVYFASLEGSLWSPRTHQLVPNLYPSIADESISGFTLQLWLQVSIQNFVVEAVHAGTIPPFQFVVDPKDFLLFAQQQSLYVSWAGCQMPPSATRRQTRVEIMREALLARRHFGG